MTHATALAYLSSIAARMDALDASLAAQRRQAIRGTIYLLSPDPVQREAAITEAHRRGLLTSPLDTLAVDIQRVVTEVVNDELIPR
jgi:hypothetical protein